MRPWLLTGNEGRRAMMADTTVLVLSAILLWLMIMTAAALRSQGWTPGGVVRALGNRDNMPEPTPLAGRAERAAKNMLENMVLFVALFVALQVANKANAQAQLGANLFFWGRLAFWPTYLAGIIYLRTAFWIVSIAGLVMMILAMR
jgi:uncharacterized MAPEG superfamily protein